MKYIRYARLYHHLQLTPYPTKARIGLQHPNFKALRKMSHSAGDSENGDVARPSEEPQPGPSKTGTSDNDRKSKGKGAPPKKRDTHFLCFPLVTDTSIPQLAESLKHFRNVTTKPSRSTARSNRPETEQPSENEPESREQPQLSIEDSADIEHTGGNPNDSNDIESSPINLKLLPAVAHRPPGTFHLTLGVMDLSKQEDMDRALSLLQELDYTEIFNRVLNEPRQASSRHEQSASDDQLPSDQEPNEGVSHTFSREEPPTLSLTGLSTFPAAKSSRVFFAKPSPTSTSTFPLLLFGQAIRRKFREAGFITETRPLVLHATVANMRYAVQAKGGRTSKGKNWRFGKDRWKDGLIDAREMIKCFDVYGGDTNEYVKGGKAAEGEEGREFTWSKDIVLNRVAICKMGAEKSEDDVLGMVYPPVGEKLIFE